MKKLLLVFATVVIVASLQTLHSMDTEEGEMLGEQEMGMDVDMDGEESGDADKQLEDE